MSQDILTSPTPVAPIEVLTSPFVRFSKMEASSGILLLITTVAALVWANSPWEQSYHAIWNAQLPVGLGGFVLSESRHEWINDGLMSIFFFLVGLEIKREVLIGELCSLKQAAFPFLAALGGVIVPALLYLLVSHGTPSANGWGIPMATDIAFALGVLALLGRRVPTPLKVFVAALAIVDDIFAILVIAVFYTAHIHFLSLGAGLAGVALSLVANLLGIRKPGVYAVIGTLVWFAVLKSGVHATVAGVLLAFTIPARTHLNKSHFLKSGRWLLDRFESADVNSADEHAAIYTLENHCDLVQSPLHRIEHRLQPWVSFVVMPLFAFSNAGVHILGNVSAAARNSACLGVALGLFVGKPLGIWLCAWLSAKANLAAPPAGVSWRHILGASWLCGIGFTMALFVASLAFGDGVLLDMAKIGTMAASVCAGICGAILLGRKTGPPVSADG